MLRGIKDSGSENYSCKRVIRYEENKEAEVFTLVIRGTVENSWFYNSTSGNEFIEVNESELMDVLTYGKTENLIEKVADEDHLLFRF